TPVAHLTPVLILGSTVTRATLHNEEEIKRLDAKIGDTVIIQKAGDVIPEIVQVLKEMRVGRERKFIMPKLCPVCGSKTVKDPDGPLVKCLNIKCPSRRRRGLYYFVSKRAFNIVGMGPKIIDAILDNSLIQDAADIFDLREGDLIPIERFAEKSAKNLVSGIEARRDIPFERFIIALGMLHVGDETAEDLAGHFSTIEGLKSATIGELEAIPNIGGVVAKSIYDWFRDKGNGIFLEKLLRRVSIIYEKKVKSGKLSGKSFVLTGVLESMSREEARGKVKALGGDVHESVSKNTGYVVTGENPGSKYDRAKSLGVKILSEKEFLSLLKK
ncbi:MAG TPA: NAD-dependent DNA ligase LigA, partial [Candidatus Paceibacterota bacterium]